MRFFKTISSFIFLFCFGFTSLKFSTEKIDSLITHYKISDIESEKSILLEGIEDQLNELDKEKEVGIWKSIIDYCEQNDDYKGLGFCYYNLGVRLKNEAEYSEALTAYTESQKNYERCNFKPGLARVENGLGILFKDLNKFETSYAHYKKSAILFMELKDSVRVGWIYLNLGGMLEKQDSLKQAKIYLKESQKLLEKLHDSNIISCYINLGEVYNKQKKYDSAYFYYLKSYELSRMKGEQEDKFQTLYHLGQFLFLQNRFTEAAPIIIEVKDFLESADNINFIKIEDRANFAKLLSEFYAQRGDYQNAYYSLKESSDFELENKREQSIQEINRQEFDKMENIKNLKLNRRLWTMYISIAGFLGSILLFFAFYRSYKHKKEANRLLTEMDELKNKFYSNITHELRTPLTLILGPLEQMLSDETKKTPSRKQVKTMRKNANSLLNLVNQMLDLSKIEAKSMKLEMVEEDIDKFLRTRFAAFASLAEQKSITYHCSLLNEKNVQIFDSQKLEKIINNLLSNAIKFTGKNGTVGCYANFHHRNTLELIVQDDGKGIPKDELNGIFDRFHQVHPKDELINIGTGIGLSLTKELVELMHGKIKVESEVGRGSKFTVTLPLGTEHLASDEFRMIQNQHSKTIKPAVVAESVETEDTSPDAQCSEKEKDKLPHILIVEDNIDIREFIAENLSDCFNVDLASNGKAGLKRAVKNIPDLVITDIVMPKMDGIELCENLKTDEKTSHIPVVMLTGKSSIEDRLTGLDTGADAYLTKPFNIKELRMQVTKLIEQRQKLRERFTRDLRLEPKDIAVTSADEKFIARAMEIIEKNMGNSEFEVRQFQDEMFMSRMQLFRKIKALTNQTPGEFIRTIRLKRAASLIKQNFGNIAQITYEVGFNNPSYFAKCFKDLYGELPSDFIKSQNA